MLTGQRRVLVDALRGKSRKCDHAIRMYVEALRAIERNDGPEALHCAAYELREMMNALPAALDVPIVSPPALRGKVQDLNSRWQSCSERTTSYDGERWNGQIDSSLERFLGHLSEFFVWVAAELPTRQKDAGTVLERLLPSAIPMPQVLVERRIAEWASLLGYFNSLTHHNETPALTQLLEKLGALETFLLDHLNPRTFEDQDEIDLIIQEAEGL